MSEENDDGLASGRGGDRRETQQETPASAGGAALPAVDVPTTAGVVERRMVVPRRRQANGRPNRVGVSLTDQQLGEWRTAANADSVSIQRWMVDRIEGRPPTMINRALVAEVNGIRLDVNGAFSNLNQLARIAHHEGVNLNGWMMAVARVSRASHIVEQWMSEHR